MSAPRWLALTAALLYLVSLALPAVHGSGFPDQSGLDMLRQGATAWRDGILAWYANPLFWLSLILILSGRHRLGLAASVIGLVLALSSFTAASMAERAGRGVPEFDFAPGFYLWLGAFLLLVAASLYRIYKVSGSGSGRQAPIRPGSRD